GGGASAALIQELLVSLDRLPERRDPARVPGRRGEHERAPSVRAGPEGGELEQAGLEGLDLVAQVRDEHYDRGRRDLPDLDVDLAGADRLDEDHLHSEGVEQS